MKEIDRTMRAQMGRSISGQDSEGDDGEDRPGQRKLSINRQDGCNGEAKQKDMLK